MNKTLLITLINNIVRMLIASGHDVYQIEQIIVDEARRVSDEIHRGVFK